MMSCNLPCVVLCGGLATRLGPLTSSRAKSLIEINGEPFLAHQLRLLRSNGIRKATLCAGHFGNMIEQFAGDGSAFGMELSYSFDGDRLLGTGGAIRKALPHLEDKFFVLYGDSYLPCDYRAVAEAFNNSGKRGLMTVFHNQGEFDSSNVEVQNERIIRYDKQDKSEAMQYIDYGLGVFDKAAFTETPSSLAYDLADVYQRLLAADDLGAFQIKERFYEIGSLAGISDLQHYLQSTGKE